MAKAKIMKTRTRLAALAVAVAAGFTGTAIVAPSAQAHHNYYQSIYHSTRSVVPSLTYANDVGTVRGLGQSTVGTCCYNNASVYVGSAHDLIETSRENPNWVRRLANTGWYPVARLASPGHMTYRAVPNGGY